MGKIDLPNCLRTSNKAKIRTSLQDATGWQDLSEKDDSCQFRHPTYCCATCRLLPHKSFAKNLPLDTTPNALTGSDACWRECTFYFIYLLAELEEYNWTCFPLQCNLFMNIVRLRASGHKKHFFLQRGKNVCTFLHSLCSGNHSQTFKGIDGGREKPRVAFLG